MTKITSKPTKYQILEMDYQEEISKEISRATDGVKTAQREILRCRRKYQGESEPRWRQYWKDQASEWRYTAQDWRYQVREFTKLLNGEPGFLTQETDGARLGNSINRRNLSKAEREYAASRCIEYAEEE